MFESAEIGHQISKKVYKERELVLREALLGVQYELLRQARFPVLMLVNGVDGAGKGETVNLLNAWMDPRHIRTEAFGPESDEGPGHPEMWRFWHGAAAQGGNIGILFGSWYTDPILAHVMGTDKKAPSISAWRHPPFRAHAGGRRGAAHQVLVPPVQEGSEASASRRWSPTPKPPGACHPRRLGAPQAL
jgi:polyphosphate kinase 2 (PPK2 family)